MWVFILLSLKLQHIDKKMRWIQWNENWIDLGIVTTSKLELKLLPEVKLELWHSVRGNFRNLNLNVLNYRVECVFRIWQVSFTSQVFPSSYKQLSIGDHKNSPNLFENSEFILYRTLRWLRCAAYERLAFTWDALWASYLYHEIQLFNNFNLQCLMSNWE